MLAASIACSALTIEKNSTGEPVFPRRVDQRIAPATALERHFDGVARGARLIEGNDALLAHQRIDQGGLADVRPSHDSDPRMALVVVFLLGPVRERRQHRLEQLLDACSVSRGNRRRRAHTQFMKLGHRDVGGHPLGLVHRDVQGRLDSAQSFYDQPVAGGDASASVHHEHHGIGFGNGLVGLPGHFDENALRGPRLEAARIDGNEPALTAAPLSIVAVAGHARHVVDDGVPAAGQPIE